LTVGAVYDRAYSKTRRMYRRRALINRCPYEIIFEIESDKIIIYAIYHCARDPEIWQRRRDA